jgi:hypothetical protein
VIATGKPQKRTRQRVLYLMLTEGERKLLDQVAALRGLTASGYARMVLLDDARGRLRNALRAAQAGDRVGGTS